MDKSAYILIGGVGTFIAGYLPVLLGLDNGMGLLSVIAGVVGGVGAIIFGYKFMN